MHAINSRAVQANGALAARTPEGCTRRHRAAPKRSAATLNLRRCPRGKHGSRARLARHGAPVNFGVVLEVEENLRRERALPARPILRIETLSSRILRTAHTQRPSAISYSPLVRCTIWHATRRGAARRGAVHAHVGPGLRSARMLGGGSARSLTANTSHLSESPSRRCIRLQRERATLVLSYPLHEGTELFWP